jgi:hypothetical protein
VSKGCGRTASGSIRRAVAGFPQQRSGSNRDNSTATPGLVRHRDFQLLAGSVGVSALGDWLALTPIVLYLQESMGSGIVVAAHPDADPRARARPAPGRAYAAYNGLRNGAELIAIASGGVLVVAIGARWTLFLAGAIPALAGLAGLAAYARLRERDEAAPVVVPEPELAVAPPLD